MALSLKQKIGAGMMAAFMAATPVAGIVANDAQAQTARATPTATQPAAKVPVVNARGFNDAYLRVAVAEESKGAVVLIVYGNNRDLYSRVKAAAEQATAEGFPVKGIMVANGKDGVEIYANTISYAVHSDPGPAIEAQTKVAIKNAHRVMQKVGMVDGPALAEVK
jgi:hypothetical protein